MSDRTKRRPLTVDDLWGMARVGAPTPSPDGSFAVAPVTTYDMATNKGRTRLWRVPLAEEPPTPLTASDVSSDQPAFSPDGQWLAFVRRKEGEKPQVYRMPLNGGEAEKLTDLPLGAGDPKWLPDGKRLVFVASVCMSPPGPVPPGGAQPTPATPPEPDTIIETRRLLAAREQETVKARVTEDRVFRFWDRWLTGGEVPHLFAIDLETRVISDLTPDSTHWFDFMEPCGQYDLAPDGSELAFSADASPPPHQTLNWDLFTVALANDAGGVLRGGPIRNITKENPGNDLKPRYSPDGTAILYGRDTDLHFYADRVRLARYDRKSGAHLVLTEAWDRSLAGWDWHPDGNAVWITAEDEGRQALFTMPPEPTAQPLRLLAGGAVSGVAPAADGRVWFQNQDLSHPVELFVLEHGSRTPRQRTRFNEEKLAALDFGPVEERHFQGAGGARVQMYLVHPPGFDPKKKYPLVHVIHGGPHGISGDQFHWRWNGQMFAAPGYVVAMVNFHGSTSWGQAFAASISGDHPTKPFADIMAATDELLKLDYIDGTRMAATGGSYGGYLVTWIAGHTDRFAALVNHAGVYDLHAQYASDVSQGRAKAYGGEPWDGIENIDKASPARSAAGFRTPMLVLHGDNDYRVPATQGLEAYGVLKAKGIPARLVSYPDENHWILQPRNSRHWYGEVHAWLARFLKP
ncbi:MAG: dipeptidyl aminopeptidase/acylaminoacyl-peptidase [bacterium]|nr:MAG: dipeptidyl aminopeptidase/acylaminoacyl-peptidase [bacterium]